MVSRDGRLRGIISKGVRSSTRVSESESMVLD